MNLNNINLKPGDIVKRVSAPQIAEIGLLIQQIDNTSVYPIWYVLHRDGIGAWAKSNISKVE
jgi:hypothetical protein